MFKESALLKSRGWEYTEITLDLNKVPKKKKKVTQISFFDSNRICERCRYFKSNKEYHSIDCLNNSIDQESYFKHLGEIKEGCLYFEERVENIGC